MANSASHPWIALGTDEFVLSALCEHLPANLVIVTTREALTAQLEAQQKSHKNTVVLMDESAQEKGFSELLSHAGNLHLLVLKSPAGKPVQAKAASLQYIDKPVKISNLGRLVSRVLSHSHQSAEAAIGASCTLRPDLRQITNPVSGAQSELTEKEVQILMFLSRQSPAPATREQLHKEVWGFQGELNTHTLETHIYRLRTKLKDIGAADVKIENTAQGYILTAA